MMQPEERERWQRALEAHEDTSDPDAGAPDPERLWGALAGELEPLESRAAIVDALHAPQGHEELRLFLELERALELDTPVDAPRRIPWKAAAVILAAAALLLLLLRPSDPPLPEHGTIRAPAEDVLHTELDGGSLPREEFELRWDPIAEGCTYAVRASSIDGEVLVDVTGIDQAAHRLSREQLEGVSDGAKVLWQIDFKCEETSGQSRTFSTVVGP